MCIIYVCTHTTNPHYAISVDFRPLPPHTANSKHSKRTTAPSLLLNTWIVHFWQHQASLKPAVLVGHLKLRLGLALGDISGLRGVLWMQC